MKKGDWIFIGYGKDAKCADLMCQIYRIENDKIRVAVINGAWDGTFDVSQQCLRVHATREVIQASIVYNIQDIPKGDYNYVIETVNKRLRKGRLSLSYCNESVRPAGSKHNSLDETVGQASKLRRVLLSPTRYLAIDLQHGEVRLFERQYKRNVFLRSMPL
jgi:hypothetical protein